MTKSYVTKFGIPGIDTVPYGTHMCHLYSTREELLDGLMQYFLAGLYNFERCIWIASHPLPAAEIKAEIGRTPVFERALASGQLSISDSVDWYGPPESTDCEHVIQKWFSEEDSAIKNGFQALRMTGNTSFVVREHWSSFMDYEERLHQQLTGRRIVGCCSYPRDHCKPVEMLEVVHRHHGALERCDGQWEVTPSPKGR